MVDLEVHGDKEIITALSAVADRIPDTHLVAADLADLMRHYVHVITGYLKSTIGNKDNYAYATADYAADEALRGGAHAYEMQAIEAAKVDGYADWIVEPYEP